MTEWYPIDTAPKDGTSFLAFHPAYSNAWYARGRKPGIMVDWWSNEAKGFWHDMPGARYTHWTHLPPGPL